MLLIGVRVGVAIGGQGQALLPWTGSRVSTCPELANHRFLGEGAGVWEWAHGRW